MDAGAYIAERAKRLEPLLGAILPVGDSPLESAMRYAVLGGGKRLRPVLAMAAADSSGGDGSAVAPAACALELIHAYSLVHDDLPAMDNAEERRGRPSCHRVFGEAVAVLAGDALLTFAFELLARKGTVADPEQRAEAVRVVAEAAGVTGMVGGQADDILGATQEPEAYARMAQRKTGALFLAAVRIGALLAGAPTESLDRYGAAFGLAFQLADDLEDGDGFVALFGEPATRARAQAAVAEAAQAVRHLGERGDVLVSLARWVLRESG